MDKLEMKAHEYLRRCNMHHEQIDLDQCLRNYIEQMQDGLSEKPSPLMMLPSFVYEKSVDLKNRKVIVIDAGGTNLRVALVAFDENATCYVQKRCAYRMPGYDKHISKTAFFDTLAGYIEPFLDDSKTIVISFAFPTQILENMDGRILQMVKEIKIDDIEGSLLGDGIKRSLLGMGYEGCEISVTNDTIATCLAGKASAEGPVYDSYIGLVLGTGVNTCYFEQAGKIKKLSSDDSAQSMIINIESGNFDKQRRGAFDLLLDEATIDPGQHTLEKMVSGAYIGMLIDIVIKESEKQQFFSQSFYDAYTKTAGLGTVDFSSFANGDENAVLSKVCTNEQDAKKLHVLIKLIVKRAAKLVALQIAGAAMKCNKGKAKDKPICVTAEGTTYYKLKYMKEEVEQYIKQWLEKDYGIFVRLVHVDDAVLKGAAIVGL